MIADKEIGKIWRASIDGSIVRKLIRKLVEERALYKYADHNPKDLAWKDVKASYIWNALHNFGIDPEEFNQEKY